LLIAVPLGFSRLQTNRKKLRGSFPSGDVHRTAGWLCRPSRTQQ
jgi:hypothetical protein